jgi:hypothetical protein
MTNAQQTPDPEYAYLDIEQEFISRGVELGDEARDTLIQIYNVTVGHYLVEMQPEYSYDLWREDGKFRLLVLEEVRNMATDLVARFGRAPDRAQIYDASKDLLRRMQLRVSSIPPWVAYFIPCQLTKAIERMLNRG